MNYTLNELLDIPTLQGLLDSLDEINKLPSAILDIEGNILTATAWQDVCTKFHRINNDTVAKCTESDTGIEVNVAVSVSPVVYRCPMGLIDAASPIVIEDRHLGNVFIGQLFTEQPDVTYFVEQARKYGFDEIKYLEAVHEVPVCTEEQLRTNLAFIGNFVQMLAEQGLQSRRQIELENELRESQTKLKVIFDTSEAGIIVVSPLGIISFANRRIADMFGFTVPEIVGTRYIDHLHESEKQSGEERMKQISIGEIKSLELDRHYVRKDGSDFWGHLTATRFDNLSGDMLDQIIVICDVTERKRVEAEEKLLEQQLQQTQRLESLGVLAGGIAHDFNNILAIIMCNCSIAKQQPQAADDCFTEIEKAVDRAAELCSQMLAYAGKTQFIQSRFNIEKLVKDMVQMLSYTINKNAVITLDCRTDIPLIKADSNQIKQIVVNLIINASEAIGKDHGTICVSLAKTLIGTDQTEKDHLGSVITPGWYVTLEVIDNGCGMDDEIRRRIFEPFYSTKFPGRGLGMSAVLGIITSHKGALQLSSEPERGTTVKVFLPALPSQPGEEKSIPRIASGSWQGKGTILLVEDEELLRYLAKTLLEELGFIVIEASNGIEAIEQYQKDRSDITLVMTDIGMPVMDGYELFHELKRLNPELPIIISSGFGDDDVISHIAREHISGLIGKPYNFEKLRDVLKNVVEGK